MRPLRTIARIIGDRLWIRMDEAGQRAAEAVSPAVVELRARRAAYAAGHVARGEREAERLRICREKFSG